MISALASALVDAFPERAHAPLLARVCERLGAVVAPSSEIAGELRVQVQEAASAWFSALATERNLVLLVDGLEHVDEGSVACLLEIALKVASTRTLLVCTLSEAREPFDFAEREVFARVFGAPTLQLLAGRYHRVGACALGVISDTEVLVVADRAQVLRQAFGERSVVADGCILAALGSGSAASGTPSHDVSKLRGASVSPTNCGRAIRGIRL